ncbi:hypothetical protein DFP72DRAFT_1051576 [Ephemerocybe angulata]|uniref:Uncharacterized protein n=1 Tax=Ephemerocybe angulata TaxID=980116 RepID=A0A8H6HF46_9AGAR|nr:hypothetical protein DFP72DRAFT_1051576 [Tulosesus angulatus]
MRLSHLTLAPAALFLATMVQGHNPHTNSLNARGAEDLAAREILDIYMRQEALADLSTRELVTELSERLERRDKSSQMAYYCKNCGTYVNVKPKAARLGAERRWKQETLVLAATVIIMGEQPICTALLQNSNWSGGLTLLRPESISGGLAVRLLARAIYCSSLYRTSAYQRTLMLGETLDQIHFARCLEAGGERLTVKPPYKSYVELDNFWYYSIKSIWKVDDFPIEQGNKGKPENQSMEVKIVRLASLGSLVFEIVMICVLFIPKVKNIKFPQTACDMAYGTRALW